MFPGFAKIIEERIAEAQKNGDFDNLEGAGQPLKLCEDGHIPPELRLAYKILKNADCLPPEIELKKEILLTEDLLAGMGDTAEKYQVIKKLNFLIMKLNALRGCSAAFEMPQRYEEKLTQRFGSKQGGETRSQQEKK